jgi:hypothetical protein
LENFSGAECIRERERERERIKIPEASVNREKSETKTSEIVTLHASHGKYSFN